MTFTLWGPKLGAQTLRARTESVPDMHGNMPRGKVPVNPNPPGIRLTERQQLALALRESERLAAAIEYHDDVSDSCSSDAESEDAFSSVHGKLDQAPLATEQRTRISSCQATKHQAFYSRVSGDHSPNKSDLVGSHDSCALRVGSGHTFLTSDVCNSLDGYSRQQHCSGATLDPLRAVSVCQTDRDSDAEDEASHLHPLSQRLWSSNSEDSTAAAGLALTDHDANSCHLRPLPAVTSSGHSNDTFKPAPTSQQATPLHKRGQVPSPVRHFALFPSGQDGSGVLYDDAQEAISFSVPAVAGDKRQRLSNDANPDQTLETVNVHPNVTERRRRRQQKLGGCRAAARQAPATAVLKSLASPPQQQAQPSLRRSSTRQIHRVVLQESDPFADAAVSAAQHSPVITPPVRVRLRKPAHPAAMPHCRSSPVASQKQDIDQEPNGSSCFSGARTLSSSSHPVCHVDAMPASSPSSLQMLPITDDVQQPVDGTASSPSTPRVQASSAPASGQPAAAGMTAPLGRASTSTPLPFGSPAVVRQSASFFSSPTHGPSPMNEDSSSAAAPPPPSEATAVVTITPMSVAAAVDCTPAGKGSSRPAATLDTHPPGQSAVVPLTPMAAAAAGATPKTAAPASTLLSTPPLQRKRLRLRPPSSEAESSSALPRVTSFGPAPPFLEQRSPSEPPVVVLRARRSRAATPRSIPRTGADSQATTSIRLSPCTPRSDSSSCSGHPRSVASSFSGGKTGSLAGSASNVSSMIADGLRRESSGCPGAAGFAAGCSKLRQLKQLGDSPVCTPTGAPHQLAGSGSDSGVEDLCGRVSQSVQTLQRRQQAEGRLMQRHTEATDSAPLEMLCGAPKQQQQQQHASVADGCAALRSHQSSFRFPSLPGLVRDASIEDQQDSLTVRQELESSTLHALRDWLAGGC